MYCNSYHSFNDSGMWSPNISRGRLTNLRYNKLQKLYPSGQQRPVKEVATQVTLTEIVPLSAQKIALEEAFPGGQPLRQRVSANDQAASIRHRSSPAAALGCVRPSTRPHPSSPYTPHSTQVLILITWNSLSSMPKLRA